MNIRIKYEQRRIAGPFFYEGFSIKIRELLENLGTFNTDNDRCLAMTYRYIGCQRPGTVLSIGNLDQISHAPRFQDDYRFWGGGEFIDRSD